MKKLFFKLAAVTALMLVTTTANAELDGRSIFAPAERQAIEFELGEEEGLDYPSFNSFTENPNIAGGAMQGDERLFTTVTTCEDGVCENQFYRDQEVIDEETDVLRFQIYFHNNASDPYDDLDGQNQDDVPDAENVRIGIDLNDIFPEPDSEPDAELTLRPNGFIYADNNEYRTDRNDVNSRINYPIDDSQKPFDIQQGVGFTPENGTPVRTAVDDVDILRSRRAFNLKIRENFAGLYIAGSGTAQEITEETEITFETEEGPQTVNVRPVVDAANNRIWLEFDRLPGCFRYSGFAYFEAEIEVEPEPIGFCPDTVDGRDNPVFPVAETLQIDGNTATRISARVELEDVPQEVEDNVRFIWTANNPNGRFLNDDRTERDTGSTTSAQDEVIIFVGPSSNFDVQIDPASIDHEPFDFDSLDQCTSDFKFPPPVCEELFVRHQDPIFNQTISTFTARAQDNFDTDFGDEINYSVDDIAFGIFFTEENERPPDLPDNPAPFIGDQFFMGFPDELLEDLLDNLREDFNAIDLVQDLFHNAREQFDAEQLIRPEEIFEEIDTPPLPPRGFGQNNVLNAQIPGLGFTPPGQNLNPPGPQPQPGEGLPQNPFPENPFGINAGFEFPEFANGEEPIFNQLGEGIRVELRDQGNFFNQGDWLVELDPQVVDPNLFRNGFFEIQGPDVTVPAREPVFFAAFSPGEEVIHVQAVGENGERPQACLAHFDIVDRQLCDRVEFRAFAEVAEGDYEVAECIDPNFEHTFDAQFFDTNGELIDLVDATVRWTTTDPNGVFITLPIFQETAPGEDYVGFRVVNYRGGGQVTATLESIGQFDDAFTVNPDVCTVTIEECPEENIFCETFEVGSNPESPFLVGEEADIFINQALDNQGDPLPGETPVRIVTDTNGNISHEGQDGEEILTTLETLIEANPANFTDSQNAGSVIVQLANPELDPSGQCFVELPVIDEDFVCEDLKLLAVDVLTDETVGLLLSNSLYKISAEMEFNTNDPNVTDDVRFSSDHGIFIPLDEAELIALIQETGLTAEEIVAERPELRADVVIPGNDGIFFYTFVGTPLEVEEALFAVSVNFPQFCKDSLPLEGLPVLDNFCVDLTLATDPAAPFTVGEDATIKVESTLDRFGEALPEDTPIRFQTSAGGEFQSGDETGNEIEIPLNQATEGVTFEGSTQTGTITVDIPADNDLSSEQCVVQLEVIDEALVCEDLQTILRLDSENGAQVIGLTPGTLYHIDASASYSDADFENGISYSSDHGVFIPETAIDGIRGSLNALDRATLLNQFPQDVENLPEDQNIFFFTFDDVPDSISEALIIRANGFFNPECTDIFPLDVPEQPLICVDLDITPFDGVFDPSREQVLILTGDFRDHQGNIRVTTNSGTLRKVSENQTSVTVTFERDELRDQNTDFAVVYIPDPDFDPTRDSVLIVAEASGNQPQCRDTIETSPDQEPVCIDLDIVEPDRPWIVDGDDDEERFEIRVTTNPSSLRDDLFYNWEVVRGGGEWEDSRDEEDQTRGVLFNDLEDFDEDTVVRVSASETSNGPAIPNCVDEIRAIEEDEERPPEIQKVVFKENDVKNYDDFVNIGQQDRYVTYGIVFHPGDAKSAKIYEESMNLGVIRGSLGGALKFTDMRINVKDGNDEYTILKTDNYRDDSDRNNELSDRDYDENNNDSLGEYEDDYECPSSRGVCIEGDFDDVVEDFKNGRAIEFRNLGRLTDDDDLIVIKYQMRNLSVINDDSCEDLTADTGCGEIFKNEIAFEAWTDNNFNGSADYEDDDEARVVVICPFILTRSGGDAFFLDALDTGIDVAQCSEVKGSSGAVIRKIPRPEREVPRTGQGGLDSPLVLDLPSHDICRYSNLNSNIEGYDNVLENFSSTVCELEAEVSEIWTEENINNSITANIRRIARWGQNLNSNSRAITLTGMESLSDKNNAQSGVFVKDDGDLILDFNAGSRVGATSQIPAAQTYIVQGHDLIIKSDIKYSLTDYTDILEIPSLALVVIDGNIIIDNEVEQIDAVIISVDTDQEGDDGKVTNVAQGFSPEAITDKILTINGSLAGDVFELFSVRRGVGDPNRDQGSVTIRYNENLLLNPPPGLRDLVDITQFSR